MHKSKAYTLGILGTMITSASENLQHSLNLIQMLMDIDESLGEGHIHEYGQALDRLEKAVLNAEGAFDALESEFVQVDLDTLQADKDREEQESDSK